MLPDSGQNGTPERCASRTAVAHRAIQPSRSPTGSLPGSRPASPDAGVAGVVSGWAGRGMSITLGMSFSEWADWVYTVRTRASCGRCVRSATRTVPVVDRQQRDRQQAHPVRGPRGARRHRHTDSAPQGCAAEQRAWSESSFEQAVQDKASRCSRPTPTPHRVSRCLHDRRGQAFTPRQLTGVIR